MAIFVNNLDLFPEFPQTSQTITDPKIVKGTKLNCLVKMQATAFFNTRKPRGYANAWRGCQSVLRGLNHFTISSVAKILFKPLLRGKPNLLPTLSPYPTPQKTIQK